jgi:uncharacterized protein involved in outer membrane biogenesis
MASTGKTSGFSAFFKAFRKIITVSFAIATVIVVLLLILIQFPSVQRTAVNTLFRHFGSDFGFRIRLDSLHINWFRGTIRADDVRMMPVPMDTPARITIESVSLDIRVRDFFRGRTTIDSLSVVNPVFTLEQMPDGTIKWPWVTQSQPDDAPAKSDKKPSDPAAPAFPDTLRIDSAGITNGHFQMLTRGSESPPTAIEGLSLNVSTKPGLTNLLGELTVNSAYWRHPSTGETLALTQPLTLNLHSDTQPIFLVLNSEISGFPLTLDGHISPLTEVMTYAVSLKGKGPVVNILNTFGVAGISTEELDISIDAASDGMLIPDIALSLTSPGLTIGPTRFDTATLVSTLSQKTLHADLVAETGPGRMSISLESTVVPSVSDWSADITFRHFPLDMIEPWIPDMIDLKGLVDGAVSASGPSTDWTETDAAGTLTIARTPGRVRPHNAAGSAETPHYVLRPEGTLDLRFRHQQLNLTRLNLVDDSLRVNMSGFWNIPDQTWSASAAIHSDDLTPWAAMAGFNAGGKANITADFAQPENGADIAGEGRIELLNAFYDTYAIPVASLDVSIAESRFSADIEQLVFDDLTLTGNASGDLTMPEHTAQKIALKIESLKWRDMPEQTLTARWERSERGQKATLHTRDDTVRAELTSSPAGGWKGFCDLDTFNLGLAGTFLPEPLNDLTGTLTSRIELDTTLPGDNLEIAVYLNQLTATVMDRTIQTAAPGRIVYRPESVSVSELALTTDDGSRVSADGIWALKASVETSLQTDILIPELQSWPIPGAPDDLSGAVSADLILRTHETHIVPEGIISATGVTVSGMHIADTHIRLTPPDIPGGFSLDLSVNGFQPGTGDETPELSTTGTIDIGPGYESFDTLSVSVTLDMLEAVFSETTYRNDGQVLVHLGDQRVVVERFVVTGPETQLTLDGSLALTDDNDDPGYVTAGIRTSMVPLAGFMPDSGIFGGNLTADFNIAGPASSPVITGEAELLNMSWDNPDFPGPVERLKGVIQLTEDEIRFQNISFRFGGGRIEIPGTITRDGTTLNAFNLSARIRDIDMDVNPDLYIRGGGDVHLRGDWPDIGLIGAVRITEALYTPEFDLIDLLADLTRPRVVIAEDTQEADDIGGLPLDLTVLAQDNIRIENSHMNLSLDARLQITGTTAVPGVLGAVTLRRGVIDLLLHEFEITSGTVNFTTPFDIDPSLDIKAETITQGEVIRFHITGRASRPNLLLSSDTGKSHAEIMTLLLGQDLGTGESDLGAMAMDYAKQAAARAAAQAIGARTDLIVVPFPVQNENENLLVGIGRRFGDRWKFMYYFGEKSEEGDVIEMEYELNQKTDLRLRQNQDGSVSGGFRYRQTFN